MSVQIVIKKSVCAVLTRAITAHNVYSVFGIFSAPILLTIHVAAVAHITATINVPNSILEIGFTFYSFLSFLSHLLYCATIGIVMPLFVSFSLWLGCGGDVYCFCNVCLM